MVVSKRVIRLHLYRYVLYGRNDDDRSSNRRSTVMENEAITLPLVGAITLVILFGVMIGYLTWDLKEKGD